MNSLRHLTIASGVTLMALAWALPAAAGGGTWKQIGYNAGHTGFNNTETRINSGNAHKLVNTGTFTTSAVPLQPMIYKGVMYDHSNDQNLYAWDLATGTLLWSIPLATIDGPNGMAISDGILVANCGFQVGNGICAFSTKTGKALWSYGLQNGGGLSPPTIDGHTVYYGQSGMNGSYNADNFVAVDLKTGAQLWIFGSCNGGNCESFGASAAAVDNGLVYFGCRGGSTDPVTITGVCAADASTGALVWQTPLGVSFAGDGNGLLIAQGGTVYAAYRTADCNQCGYTLDLTALNGTTGTPLWDTPLTPQLNDSYFLIGTPVLGPDGTVYQGISTSNNPNQPNLFALNPSGAVMWSQSTVQQLPDPPTIVGKKQLGVLLFGCSSGGSSGSTCAFDAGTGTLLWESTDGYESGNFAPVVTGGRVYNSCNDNNICAYKLK